MVGAYIHIPGNSSLFSTFIRVPNIPLVMWDKGSKTLVEGIGVVRSSSLPLHSTLFVPNISLNLASVSKLLKI